MRMAELGPDPELSAMTLALKLQVLCRTGVCPIDAVLALRKTHARVRPKGRGRAWY